MTRPAAQAPVLPVPEGTPRVTYRPATPGDLEFLHTVYASTRAEEVARTGWTPQRQAEFLRSQSQAQDRHYREYLPGTQFLIIMVDANEVGRLYLDYRSEEIRIVDIALLPTSRGQGTGARILTAITSQARALELPVRIHVERENRALALYHRLGFTTLEDRGVYLFMQWQPTPG